MVREPQKSCHLIGSHINPLQTERECVGMLPVAGWCPHLHSLYRSILLALTGKKQLRARLQSDRRMSLLKIYSRLWDRSLRIAWAPMEILNNRGIIARIGKYLPGFTVE